MTESFEEYYRRQIEWSKKIFGEGKRTLRIINHIKEELQEIEADPNDLSEWVDVIMLAMDGYWRHGGNVEGLMFDMIIKQTKNFNRKWESNTNQDAYSKHIEE